MALARGPWQFALKCVALEVGRRHCISYETVYDWGAMVHYIAKFALVQDGWEPKMLSDVRIEVESGTICSVGGDPEPSDSRIDGLVLPGMANVHSHAFQRAMAGLAEWDADASGKDNFWSWREAMYRFAERLDPESQLVIARFLYIEMLKAGYTSVGEFHYLHNRPGGEAYAPTTAIADAIAQAAHESGIAMSLLPTLYATGGADGRPLSERQKRFGKSVDDLLTLRTAMRGKPGVSALGVALHSLRAVPPSMMHEAIAGMEADAPIHIHAAEQIGEVEETELAIGARPVEYLLDEFAIDHRWCLVHATHLSDQETQALARSGAVAGLCPTTEANLGDGIFPLDLYTKSRGSFAIGGDSHISVDPAEELKALEYSQRLVLKRRNVSSNPYVHHTAMQLWSEAAHSGSATLGLQGGRIARGMRADLVVVDLDDISLAGRQGSFALDSYVFVAGKRAVRDVMVSGKWIVKNRVHLEERTAEDAYRKTMLRFMSDA